MLVEQAMCVCMSWGVLCLWALWTMTSVCSCWLQGVVDYFNIGRSFMKQKIALTYSSIIDHYLEKGFLNMTEMLFIS